MKYRKPYQSPTISIVGVRPMSLMVGTTETIGQGDDNITPASRRGNTWSDWDDESDFDTDDL